MPSIDKIPLQAASIDTWSEKYQLKDLNAVPLEADPDAAKDRVARSLAAQEKRQHRKAWEKKFRDCLEVAIPGGRINSNAGASAYKSKVSLINCVVSGTIEDSIDSIYKRIYESALSLKAGCGIGYAFSTLRPSGSHVHGAGASTDGPLSFMKVFNESCRTISSAGGRRGAQMATFDVNNRDVIQFITAKAQSESYDNFNLSVLIPDRFMEVLKDDGVWEFRWGGKMDGSIRATELWDMITRSNYDFAEPGVLFIDRINRYNNLWFCENLRATNPCGEQPLPPYGSCLLGSMWLPAFVRNAFLPNAYFDYDAFYLQCRIFSRLLDNVVPLAGLPLPQQTKEINAKRRHGMGIIGLGSVMSMLGMRYGDDASVALTDKITHLMAFAGLEEGASLAREKGEAPILKQQFSEGQVARFSSRLTGLNDNWKLLAPNKGGTNSGRDLFLMSHYLDTYREDPEGAKILKQVQKYGSRYTHWTSIAPTGTISLTYGNNSSGGGEPSFNHQYIRNKRVEGRATKEAMPVYSYEYLLYKTKVEAGEFKHVNSPHVKADLISKGLPDDTLSPETIADKFSVTDDVTPEQHIRVQAAAQKWIDSSISKTINVPTSIDLDSYKQVYLMGYEMGLKGCTTFRFNPERFQGVLVRDEDLKNTRYKFTLEDGSNVEVTGDTFVEYNGETSTAANLFDSLKTK